MDKKAGKWIPEIVNELYQLANNCLIPESKERIDSSEAEKCVNDLMSKIQTQ